jgi:glucokinase
MQTHSNLSREEITAGIRQTLDRWGRPARLFLIVDQGGTNVRLRIYPASGGWEWPHEAGYGEHPVVFKRGDIRYAHELYALLTDVAKALNLGAENAPKVRAAIAFAGAVSPQRDHIPITNWPWKPGKDGQPEPQMITQAELEKALAKTPVLILNDVEAASFGLLALEEFNAWPERAGVLTDEGLRPMNHRPNTQEALAQNKALLVPGTGVGTGFIVYVSRLSGRKPAYRPEVVPCEVQHSPAAAYTPKEFALIEWLRRERTGGQPPCWEDIVSGQGLVSVYDFLSQQTADVDGTHPPTSQIQAEDDRAGTIAQAAQGDPPDPICREALGIYYAFCGRLAQILGLAVKAFGGVYLAGETTTRNWGFIVRSAYAENFHANFMQASLLEQFPLILLDKPDINLDGALYAACRRWYLRSHHS